MTSNLKKGGEKSENNPSFDCLSFRLIILTTHLVGTVLANRGQNKQELVDYVS